MPLGAVTKARADLFLALYVVGVSDCRVYYQWRLSHGPTKVGSLGRWTSPWAIRGFLRSEATKGSSWRWWVGLFYHPSVGDARDLLEA